MLTLYIRSSDARHRPLSALKKLRRSYNPSGAARVCIAVRLTALFCFAACLMTLLCLAACAGNDRDGDGWSIEAGDCDDNNPDTHPEAEEICDENTSEQPDNDCDGQIDEGLEAPLWFLDQDGDGYGDSDASQNYCAAPEGYVMQAGDCDDTDASIHPGAHELCDGLDNDCTQGVDDGLEATWYLDEDEDGYGQEGSTTRDCATPEGYVAQAGDCDDTDTSIHPGADEICEDELPVDNDCDGEVDEGFSTTWYSDEDGDGYGRDGEAQRSCDPLLGYSDLAGDCADDDPSVHPAAEESCDGVDNNCDEQIDEGYSTTWYIDADGDGFGQTESAVFSCVLLEGRVTTAGDCDDSNSAVYPGAEDSIGDNTDSDCGGTTAAEPHVGLSESSVESIQEAIEQAASGATVWVGPGEYLESGLSFQGKSIRLTSTSGPEHTIINAEGKARVLEFTSGEGADASVQGFAVIGGYAWVGGGVYVEGSSPSLSDLHIFGNAAGESGGGIALYDSSASISHCIIASNEAGSTGGGVDINGSSGDSADASRSRSGDFSSSRPTLTDLHIYGNQAPTGGGIRLRETDASLANVIISGNTATSDGGGVALWASSPTLENLSIVGNSCEGFAGGVYLQEGSNPSIRNTILAFNSSYELYVAGPDSQPSVEYCDLYDAGVTHNLGGAGSSAQSIDAGAGSSDSDVTSSGSGNLAVNPAFARFSRDGDGANDDLHPLPASPLIGAGQADGAAADIGAFGGPEADRSYYEDADSDGLPDGWELLHGLDPSKKDANADSDQDGATQAEELQALSDPNKADTDGDGALDGSELDAGTDPTNWHSQPDHAEPVPYRVPEDYETLQEAIDAVPPAPGLGLIRVSAGSIEESIYFSERSLTLASTEGASATQLEGSGNSVLSAYFSSIELEGFTLSGGDAQEGGGIRLKGVVGTLKELIVSDNQARTGAGLYLDGSSPSIRNSIIRDNLASEDGGGLFLTHGSAPTIQNCEIRGNIAEDDGGGLAAEGSSPSLSALLVVGNSAIWNGGGIFLDRSSPALDHLTIVDNQVESEGGGIYLRDGSSPSITNSILAFNGATDFYSSESAGEATLRFNDLFDAGRVHNLDGSGDSAISLDASNLSLDPEFARYSAPDIADDSLPENNYHLAAGSPLIDAGDPEDAKDPDDSRADIGCYGGTNADFDYYADMDADGMYDGWETLYGLDAGRDDSGRDPDQDGTTNGEEFLANTDPAAADTDGDGFSDGEEAIGGSDPTSPFSQPSSQDPIPLRVPEDFDSIQTAIDAAPSPPDEGYILVGPGEYAEALLVEEKRLTLRSSDGADATILLPAEPESEGNDEDTDGNSGARAMGGVLEVHESTLFLSGFTIRDGEAERGGGAYLENSNGQLEELVFSSNQASTSGGGLYLQGSSPSIRDCSFSNNGADLDGGAVYMEYSSPYIDSSSFVGNDAGQDGGGVLAERSSPSIANTQFTANHSTSNGGGLLLRYESTPYIGSSTFSSNIAGANGGGVTVDRCTASMQQVVFTENIAVEGGGGIFANDSDSSLLNISILANSSSQSGGGLGVLRSSLTLRNSLVSGNSADDYSGGIWISESEPGISNSLIAYNEGYELYVDESSTLQLSYSCVFDAGNLSNINILQNDNLDENPQIAQYSDDGDYSNDDFHLMPGSPLSDGGEPAEGDDSKEDPDGSRADIGLYGGSLADFSYYSDEDGDGIFDGWEELVGLDPTSDDSSEDPDVDGASHGKEFLAHSDPFAADSDGDGALDGEEINAGSSPVDYFSLPDELEPVPYRVPDDFATLQEAVDALPPLPHEGFIEVEEGTWTGSILLERKRLTLMSAASKAGGDGEEFTILEGDGASTIRALESTLWMKGFTVTGGTASNGGGIQLKGADGSLEDLIVTANSASSYGGGIYLERSSPELSRLELSANSAAYGGGMAFLLGSNPVVTDVNVEGNSSSKQGGGIYMNDSSPTGEGLQVSNNSARQSGGGLYLDASSPLLEMLEASGNSTQDHGGGLYLKDSRPTLLGLTVSENSASDDGGGLYLATSSPYVQNGWIASNSADIRGGGWSMDGSSPTLLNTWTEDNLAKDDGGGMYLEDSAPELVNCVLYGNTAWNKGGGARLDNSSPWLENCAMVANSADEGGGLYLFGGDSAPALLNSVLAYNAPDNLYNYYVSPGAPSISYCSLYNPEGWDSYNLTALDESNQTLEPGFQSYDSEGDGWPLDLHLAADSPLINAGSASSSDPDGSRVDMGPYGAMAGDGWDLDQDGFPAYFWPGSLDDAPAGWSPESFDCDDFDPQVQSCR